MDEQTLMYARRWGLAFEQVAATRSEPTGSGNSGYYSNRAPRTYRRPNGHEFELDSRHHSAWVALVNRALDLSMSRATTWVGLESLSQESSLSSSVLSTVLRDLRDVGLIHRKSRGKDNTTETRMFLFPLASDQTDAEEVFPVSIAKEDMPYYICQAALERRDKLSGKSEEEPEDLYRIVDTLRDAFPAHPSLATRGTVADLKKCLMPCVELAGSVQRCFTVLHGVLSTESPEGMEVVDRIGRSNNLGAYIRTAFRGWWKTYHEHSEILSLNTLKQEKRQS
jgi:hypothetical protein